MPREPLRVAVDIIKIACTCGREYDRREIHDLDICEQCGVRLAPGTLDVTFSSRGNVDGVISEVQGAVSNGVNMNGEAFATRIHVRRHEITPVVPARAGFDHRPGSYMNELRACWVKAS